MIIFPEIQSLADYEKIPQYSNIPIYDYEGTIVSKNKVGIYDDFEEKTMYGIFYYNGHGMCLKYDDGSRMETSLNKFRYLEIEDLNFENLSLTINMRKYEFTNKTDLEAFLDFTDYYNARMENFFDEAIDRIKKVYLVQKENPIIKTTLKNVVQTLPESLFVDENNYFILMHYFTCSNDIVRKYIDFIMNDTIKSYQILRSNSEYYSSMNNITHSIFNQIDIIKSCVDLSEEYMYLYLYLALTEIIIDKYSLIWQNEYDSNCKLTDSEDYIEYCAKEGIISKNDKKSIFSLACYVIKYIDKSYSDIRFTVKSINENPFLSEYGESTKYSKATKLHNSMQTKNDEQISECIMSNSYEKLNKLIGLSAIKNDVNDMINLMKMQIKRQQQGLKAVPVSLHLVFTGNPGTGKTTIARILAEIYKEIGVLSKGQLVEVDRSGLVAGYVGQTAIKTQEKIDEALGGILFIDEAYTLVKEGQDYGQEVIDTLLKAMEDHRDDFIVIVAGYSDLMQNFINSNPGLKSRFNKYIDFPDYSAEELVEIFYSMCKEYQYTLTHDAEKILRERIFDMEENKDKNFANARDVRNLFEMTITKQATRLSQDSSDNIMEIEAVDFC